MKHCRDHLGNTFFSVNEMCQHYGVSRQTFDWRAKRGHTLEECLTGTFERRSRRKVSSDDTHDVIVEEEQKVLADFYGNIQLPLDRTDFVVRDHLGNVFDSAAEMCKKYDVSLRSYNKRLVAGYSLESCLEKTLSRKVTTVVKDHRGILYENLGEMLQAYCAPKEVFNKRQSKLLPMEYCLTGREVPTDGKVYDHVGRPYDSVEQMCLTYGVSCYIFIKRLESGCSVGEALSISSYEEGAGSFIDCSLDYTVKVTDFAGNVFKNYKEACAFWCLDISSYTRYVLPSGCLDITVKLLASVKVEIRGRKYKNYREFCKKNGSDLETFLQYRGEGYSIEDSLYEG